MSATPTPDGDRANERCRLANCRPLLIDAIPDAETAGARVGVRVEGARRNGRRFAADGST